MAKKKTALKRKPGKAKKALKKKPVRKSTLKKPVSKRAIQKPAVRRPARKPARKAAAKKRPLRKLIHIGAGEKIIGEITHYFPKVRAGVIKLTEPLSVGDTIKIKGHTTDFTQKVTSLQIDRAPLSAAKKGDEIGLLVQNRVRRKDIVIKQ